MEFNPQTRGPLIILDGVGGEHIGGNESFNKRCVPTLPHLQLVSYFFPLPPASSKWEFSSVISPNFQISYYFYEKVRTNVIKKR